MARAAKMVLEEELRKEEAAEDFRMKIAQDYLKFEEAWEKEHKAVPIAGKSSKRVLLVRTRNIFPMP
eukprot:3824379-Prymnesium_polylepis.2